MTDTKIQHFPDAPYAAPQLTSPRERLVRAAGDLWRVQEASTDRILGHLRIAVDPLGLRYRAEHLHRATGAFRVIGEFWRADDAVQALRTG